MNELTKALCAYVKMYGLQHENDCPEDDTCECSLVLALSNALDDALKTTPSTTPLLGYRVKDTSTGWYVKREGQRVANSYVRTTPLPLDQASKLVKQWHECGYHGHLVPVLRKP